MPTVPGFMLSELPEPPIPVSEIGPIPPPPMFSSPSPSPQRQSPLPPQIGDYSYDGKFLLINLLITSKMYSQVYFIRSNVLVM